MYLNRLQQGMNLFVWCRTATAGAPEWPDSRPFVEVWNPSLTKIEVADMASYLPGVAEGIFRATFFLGPLYETTGRYMVIVRWVQDGVPQLLAGSFELTGGGNSAGTIISMTEVARPDARYLLTSTDAGTISRRKNPRMS